MRCASGGTPAGSLVGGRVIDTEAVGAALRVLVTRSEVTTNRATIAASDALATFRVLTLQKSARDSDVEAAIARELPLEPSRMSIRWFDVPEAGARRRVFAVAWDRAEVRNLTNAVRAAGLEPGAVDLKSACLARIAPEPECIIVDLSSDTAQLFLIDGYVPSVWSSFAFERGADHAGGLVRPLRSMLRYYGRRRDTAFTRESPVLISTEQPLAASSIARLEEVLQHPVTYLPPPGRVPSDIRHATFLTCLGLIMRRTE